MNNLRMGKHSLTMLRLALVREKFKDGIVPDDMTIEEAARLLAPQLRSEPKRRRGRPLARNGVLDGQAGRPPTTESVYVIGSPGHPVKIGFAKDVPTRVAELQTGHAFKLTVYAAVPVSDGRARAVEQRCHRELVDYRLHGEWFDIDPYQAVEIVKRMAA